MNTLQQLVRECQFGAASQLALNEDGGEVEESLLALAYDDKDLRAYAFVCSLLANAHSERWHYLASLLLSQPLCHLPGAYPISFYHAQEALQLAPEDVELKEYLLFFRDVPDRLLEEKKAIQLAQEILTVKPDSRAAAMALLGKEGTAAQ